MDEEHYTSSKCKKETCLNEGKCLPMNNSIICACLSGTSVIVFFYCTVSYAFVYFATFFNYGPLVISRMFLSWTFLWNNLKRKYLLQYFG